MLKASSNECDGKLISTETTLMKEFNQHTTPMPKPKPTINTDLNPENTPLDMKIWIDSKLTSWTW